MVFKFTNIANFTCCTNDKFHLVPENFAINRKAVIKLYEEGKYVYSSRMVRAE